jgi:hypothetical protein
MGLFTIMILICSINIDSAACQPDTAIDIVQGPKVKNELMCGLMGQTTVAGTAIAPRDGKEYMKIVCSRPSKTASLESAR